MKRSRADISLSEMRTLIAICDTGTFTAAAREVGISQPAVSRQLIRMEQRLGVLLFERDFRHPRLTSAGEQLLAYAREMVNSFDSMVSRLCCEVDKLRGELRLEASTPYFLADWTKDFNLKNPEVKLSFLFSDIEAVEEDILDGTAELGLIGRSPTHKALLYQPIGEDEVVLAVPTGHPFAARTEIELEELQDQPFITCHHRNPSSVGPIKSVLRRSGIEQPERQVVMRLESDYECLQAVAQGIGVSWVTSVLFDGDKVPGAVPVRIRGFQFKRTLYLLRAPRPLTRVAQAFLESLPGFWPTDEDHLQRGLTA